MTQQSNQKIPIEVSILQLVGAIETLIKNNQNGLKKSVDDIQEWTKKHSSNIHQIGTLMMAIEKQWTEIERLKELRPPIVLHESHLETLEKRMAEHKSFYVGNLQSLGNELRQADKDIQKEMDKKMDKITESVEKLSTQINRWGGGITVLGIVIGIILSILRYLK